MKKVETFIKNNLLNKTVVLGCSYGPDSMCLLNLLIKEKITVVCAHVNHNIRSESKKEAKDLEALCKKENIVFEKLNLEKGNNNEAYYREKRLNFFKDIADKYNTNIILTAHHADDLIETVLMRLTRGSTLSGYGGFKIISEESNYIFMKPLIYVTKNEILHFNKKYDIPYAIDKSNFTDKYKRNRYRKYILPFLKDEDKNVHKKFLEYSKEIYEADEYLNKIITKEYNKLFNGNTLNLNGYNKLDNYIKKGVLKKVLKNLYGNDIDKIGKKHIEKIVELSLKNGAFSYNLPKGFTVVKEYDKLLFSNCLPKKELSYNIVFGKEFNFKNHKIFKIEDDNDRSNFVLRLDSSKIKMPLFVRNRKEHDKVVVKNSNYPKKIKKVFIDKKVPKRLRDSYPIVVDSNDTILWIPGIVKSKFDVDKNQKCDIILKYERKDETNEEKK